MRRILVSAAAIVALWTGSSLQSSKAQWSSLIRPIWSRTSSARCKNTQAVLNQITQISHEVQSLAYQAQNLQGNASECVEQRDRAIHDAIRQSS